MGSRIISIGTAVPPTKISQSEVAKFMTNVLQLDGKSKQKLLSLYESSGIGFRHSVIKDYEKSFEDFSFFPKNRDLEPFPNTKERMQLYKKEALPVSMTAIEDCLNQVNISTKEISHIITVSCTGLYAPGLDIELIEHLGMSYSTQRTAINFMGCYAAFNALKVADQICQADVSARVLIVCVELCTLHFQKSTDLESVLVNTLFSDGAAAVLVQSEGRDKINLELEKFHCALAPEGKTDMTWDLGNHGFDMKLSPLVPNHIQQGIHQLCQDLMQQPEFNSDQIDYYAIHPGGRKILEVLEKELEISKQDNEPAYHVMYHYGNMSSPTVLFVLKHIMDQLQDKDHNKNILSFAFGPGLTLESMLLNVKSV